jgi:hypothetical protein
MMELKPSLGKLDLGSISLVDRGPRTDWGFKDRIKGNVASHRMPNTLGTWMVGACPASPRSQERGVEEARGEADVIEIDPLASLIVCLARCRKKRIYCRCVISQVSLSSRATIGGGDRSTGTLLGTRSRA